MLNFLESCVESSALWSFPPPRCASLRCHPRVDQTDSGFVQDPRALVRRRSYRPGVGCQHSAPLLLSLLVSYPLEESVKLGMPQDIVLTITSLGQFVLYSPPFMQVFDL